MTKRRGRPPTPPELKAIPTSVKLPPRLFDAYSREALRTGQSLHRLLLRTLSRGISGSQKNRRRQKPAQTVPGSPMPGTG